MKSVRAATLLITFNRPDYTEKVIQRLREIEVPRLYVYNDGPRVGNEKDALARERIIKLIESIDWSCEVFKLYSRKNHGCRLGVTNAISWAFQNEDRLIVLEDDCVPSPAFYPYCDELLERYKDDHRVWVICGENHNYPQKAFSDCDYIFTQFGFNWGWATWKRCWDNFDVEHTQVDRLLNSDYRHSLLSIDSANIEYLKRLKQLLLAEPKPSFWTVQFGLFILLNRGYLIVPKENLISNIGENGDHTKEASRFLNRHTNDAFVVRRHPYYILHKQNVEKYHYNHHVRSNWTHGTSFGRVIKRSVRLLQRLYQIRIPGQSDL